MLISINGARENIAEQTAFALRDSRFSPEDVVILNGVKLMADAPLCKGDELVVLEKGAFPEKNQLEAMMAARHTPGVHKKIREAKIAVAGLGGIGSSVAVSLARIGVGHLLLVDHAVVDPISLNRQHYFFGHLVQYKTEALKEQLLDINPFIDVRCQSAHIAGDNAVPLFDGYAVVCEALDHIESKNALIKTLNSRLPAVKVVASAGVGGYASANRIKTAKMSESLYICGDTGNERGESLMAPRVQICAGHQANMALRLILGITGE